MELNSEKKKPWFKIRNLTNYLTIKSLKCWIKKKNTTWRRLGYFEKDLKVINDQTFWGLYKIVAEMTKWKKLDQKQKKNKS